MIKTLPFGEINVEGECKALLTVNYTKAGLVFVVVKIPSCKTVSFRDILELKKYAKKCYGEKAEVKI
jgi:hypothetical protein